VASIIGDEACPQCRERGGDRTGNHLIVFDDGNKYCNRCHYFLSANGSVTTNGPDMVIQGDVDILIGERVEEMNERLSFNDVKELPTFGIPAKKITAATCEHFGVRTEFNDQGEPSRTWYPHTKGGKLDGFKSKSLDKRFGAVGSISGGDLFGQGVANLGGSFVVVTEGEDDACAVWQVLREQSDLEGWSPAVVSVFHGAKGALKDISENLEFFDSFDRVILCFDEDDEGAEATRLACSVLAGKVFITKLSEKDANAMLLAGKGTDLKWDIVKHAKKYQPDGIINGTDTWERYKHSSSVQCVPYPYKGLNEKTFGFRPGSIVTLTSGTGVGKTQVLREFKYHVWATTDWPIADISLEEDVGDSVGGLMSLHMGRRLHLPDVQVEEEHERKVHEELFGDGRWSFYDHFGGMDDSSLFNKLRYFGATGHRAIFLDHLSIIVSEYAADGGERERIDTVMTKLAKIAKELEIVIFLVVHLRKETSGKSFEQGATPSLDDLRGSGSLKQLSWDVLALSRDQQHYDPVCRNTTKITVLKCRFTGRTGPAGWLQFSEDTGRMVEVDEPANYEAERKF
jgi:twinkle protein